MSATLAVVLLALGLLLVVVAVVFGPGGSEAAVDGGTVLVAWYGLPAGGTLAAASGLAAAIPPARPAVAHRALIVSALCEIAFWMMPW